MQTSFLTAKDSFTKRRILPDDRCRYYGAFYAYSSEFEDGVVLKRVEHDGPADYKPLTWKEVDDHVRFNILEIESDYYAERNAILRLQETRIFELPPRVIFRARMVSEFLAAEADVYDTGKKVTRSDASIAKFMAVFIAEYRDQIPKKGADAIDLRKENVSPRQFRRLVKRFEEGGLDPRSLLNRCKGRTAPAITYTAEEHAFHQKYADTYLSTDQPTMKSAWEDMLGKHQERVMEGKRPLRLPALRSFQRLINEFGDFKKEYARSTNRFRVTRKFLFAQKGLQVNRPLQIVEMDEHEMDLVRLLTRNGIWNFLHPDVQARIDEKRRAWLSVALDAWSRSVVGLKILYAEPDGDAAVATLAMVAQNKERLAAMAGTTCPWPQGGTPEGVHTDAGAGYVSAQFQAAVMAFTGRHAIPPSKHPHLRARVERFFRTINQRYIHMFSGRTFSNVLLRDEYDSEKHAHITHEELCGLLVRLIVDCYHNTPHRGLWGLTPLEAWYWGSQNAEGAIKSPPSTDEYRDIFGIRDTRKIGNHGIGILNLAYRNEPLLGLRKHSYAADVLVSFNDQDISKISVKHPFLEKWTDVPCTWDGLDGVTLAEWMENLRYTKKRFGALALHSREKLLEGLAAVRGASNQSKLAAGISSPFLTAKDLRHFEKTEMASFKYSERQNVDRGLSQLHADDEKPIQTEEDPFNPVGTFEPIPGIKAMGIPPVATKVRSERSAPAAPSASWPSSASPPEVPHSGDGDPDPPPPTLHSRRPLRIETTRKKD